MERSVTKNTESTESQPPWRISRRFIIGSSFVVLFLMVLISSLVAELRTWGRHDLAGPATMRFTVMVKVSDNLPFNIGSDFYADVHILDRKGNTFTQWEDPTGQESYEAIKHLVASMRWLDESTLTFDSESGKVVIQRDESGEWSVEDRL